MGEKRVLGDTGCIRHLNSGEPLCFSLAFHSVVTLRMSWYAPPDTVGIRFVTRVYLKTPNAPGQRTFSRCAAPFFLEIRQYSCEKMSCSAQKFLAAGHIGSFQIHPRQYFKYLSRPDFPFQELFAYKYSNRKVDLFFLWERYFPRNKRSIII